MAESVYTNCYMSIAGPGDISASCKSVTINRNPDMLDDTCYGDTGKSRKKGLDDWSFDIELLDDFADAAMDDDLWAIFDAGTPVAVIWKPVNAATSASNPRYYGTGIIESYPLGGAVGDLATKRFRIICCGTVLARSDSD